jgi:HlyD family secretion protein
MDAENNQAPDQVTEGKPTQIQPATAGKPAVSNPTSPDIATADAGSNANLTTTNPETKRALGRPAPAPRRGAKPTRRRRGIWGWLILLIILIVAGVVGYFYWQGNQGPTAFAGIAGPATGRIPVSLSVSASGQISAKADLALNFGSSGTVTAMNVHQGQTVKAGDVLAKIDDSSLQNSVSTAKAQLSSAKASYDKVKTGATQVQVTQQQEAVKQAEIKYQETVNGNALATDIDSAKAQLASAQAKLAQDQQGGTGAQQAQAAASISSAQSNLQSAQIKYQQDQQGGTDAQKAQAAAAIAAAQSNLASAQAKYQQTLAGPDAATVSAAQAAVDQAQTSLTKTQSQLTSALQSASSARQQALDALNNAQDSYNNIYYANRNPDGTLKTNLTSAQTGAETNAIRALQDAQAKYDQANSAYNDAGTQLSIGVQAAQSTLNNAKIQLAKVQAGAVPADIAAAKASVDQAQASVQQAQASQAALAPTNSQLASDQASISQAQASVQQALANQQALAATTSQLASDEASVASAQANLTKLQTGGTQNDIDAAKSQLTSAQAALADLVAGAKPDDLAVSQASLDIAQASYDNAVLNLKNATLTAPFDGMITNDFNIQVGQQVAASTSIFQLVDPSALHVDVNVGETDVSKLKLGMPVAVNLDAIPGKSFTGSITFIASKATVTNNVVIYVATVTLDPIDTSNTNTFSTANNSLLKTYGTVLQSFQANRQGGQGQGNQASGTANAGTGAAGGQTGGGATTGGQAGGFAGPGGAGGFAARGGGGAGGFSLCGWTPSRITAADVPKIGMSANVTVCLNLQVPATGKVAVLSRAIKTKTVPQTATTNGQSGVRVVRYVTILDDKATNATHDVEVTPGFAGDTYTIIDNGAIKEGDQVVISSGATGGAGAGAGANNVFIGGGGGGGARGGGRGG